MHYIQNVRLKDKLSLQDRYVSLNFNNYFIINIVLWLQLNRTRNLRKNLQINFSTLSNLYFLQKAKNFTSLNISKPPPPKKKISDNSTRIVFLAHQFVNIEERKWKISSATLIILYTFTFLITKPFSQRCRVNWISSPQVAWPRNPGATALERVYHLDTGFSRGLIRFRGNWKHTSGRPTKLHHGM